MNNWQQQGLYFHLFSSILFSPLIFSSLLSSPLLFSSLLFSSLLFSSLLFSSLLFSSLDFLALAQEVDKMTSGTLDLSTFWYWLQEQTKWHPRWSIWARSGIGSRSLQNDVQEARFEHFPTLASEVYKMTSRSIDLSTLWHWLQKSTKWRPGWSI